LRVIGEVFNGGNRNIHNVRVSANFFDDAGGLVGTDTASTWLNYLRPGEKTCFQIFIAEPAGWTRYEFEPPTFLLSDVPRPAITVFNDSGGSTSATTYRIIGQARNDDTRTIDSVQIVGTLYDAADVPLGCWFGYVNSTNLAPGQTSAFDITYTGRNWNDVAAYHLQADGRLP
jgi:hypothetical protein